MTLEFYKLPYSEKSLEPYISQATLFYHYEKHHATYLNNLLTLIKNTPYENEKLESIILKTETNPEEVSIYNNAAQVWNHDFYWKSLTPLENSDLKIPDGKFKELILTTFKSEENLKSEIKKAGLNQFGSGWVWLVLDNDKIRVIKTSNAYTPIRDVKPLLCIDVWEHAYYLDYQNRRNDYLENILNHLINWNFAIQNFHNL